MSITQRIITYIFCILILSSGVICFSHIFLKDEIYEKIKLDDMRKAAGYIEKILEGNNDSKNYESLDSNISRYGLCAEVYDENCGSVFSRDTAAFCVLHKSGKEDIKKLWEKTEENEGELVFSEEILFGYTMKILNHEGQYNGGEESAANQKVKIISYSKTADVGGRKMLIAFNSPTHALGATSDVIKIELIFVFLVFVLFSITFISLLYKSILFPLARTTEKAIKLAEGDYSIKFDEASCAEIDMLNSALNYAAVELKKSEERKGEVLSDVVHDFRAPVTMIKGCAELMRDIPGENNAENINLIINQSGRLGGMIDDMLEISKLKVCELSLDISSFSLTQLLIKTVNCCKSSLGKTDRIISLECDGDVWVEADRAKIERVLNNFLSNAVKYSAEDKKITVRQSIEGENVRIDVIDEGEGIDKDELPFIWNRYYRAGADRKNKVRGTGIGLAAVKNILTLHNAEYGVLSEKGKGSDFFFILHIKQH
jgi:signal transduction histidine kinase